MKARSGLAFATSYGISALSSPVGARSQAQSIQPPSPAYVSAFTTADNVRIDPAVLSRPQGMNTARHRSHASRSAHSAAGQERRACPSAEGGSTVLPGPPRKPDQMSPAREAVSSFRKVTRRTT